MLCVVIIIITIIYKTKTFPNVLYLSLSYVGILLPSPSNALTSLLHLFLYLLWPAIFTSSLSFFRCSSIVISTHYYHLSLLISSTHYLICSYWFLLIISFFSVAFLFLIVRRIFSTFVCPLIHDTRVLSLHFIHTQHFFPPTFLFMRCLGF